MYNSTGQVLATCGSLAFFEPGERVLKLASLPPIIDKDLFLFLENTCRPIY